MGVGQWSQIGCCLIFPSLPLFLPLPWLPLPGQFRVHSTRAGPHKSGPKEGLAWSRALPVM
jgi:hypothetical protein